MAGEYLDPSSWPMWMQSGMMGPIPGSMPAQGIPDDPFERAAYTNRRGRPTAPTPDIGTPGEMLQGASMLMPGPAGAIARAPKLATGLLAGLGYLYGTDQAGGAENQQASLPRDPQGIMALQTKLRDAGLYRGEIDGIMKPNGPTERAFRQFQEQEATSRAEELQRQKLQTQQGANTAALATAKANEATAAAKLEADRLKAEKDAADLERKRTGDERLRDIEKNLSPMSRAMRDYSGPAGYLAGGIVGGVSRYGITAANNFFSKARALLGDATMAEKVAEPAANLKGVARTAAQDATNLQRVARANDFWRKGGGEVPFLLDAGKAPGYLANPKVTPLASTYNPNVHPVVEGTATALPAAEATWAHLKEQDAQQEVKDAIAAYGTDPSEANIQRINKANDNVAIWEGASNLGRVWGGSQLLGAVGSRFTKAAPGTQPKGFAAAEAEQASLQKVLRDYQDKIDRAAKKKGGLPIPPSDAPYLPVGLPPGFAGASATRARVRQ